MSLRNPLVNKNLSKPTSSSHRLMKNYLQGRFYPKNPDKYKGNVDDIVFRSSWERGFMRFCDEEPNIIAWNSEEMKIWYHNPYDEDPTKYRRYFIDFEMWVKTKDGIKHYLVEIKPHSQTIEPRLYRTGNKTAYGKRLKLWHINQAKWAAAKQYALTHGCEFIILTERDLYPKSIVNAAAYESAKKYAYANTQYCKAYRHKTKGKKPTPSRTRKDLLKKPE